METEKRPEAPFSKNRKREVKDTDKIVTSSDQRHQKNLSLDLDTVIA